MEDREDSGFLICKQSFIKISFLRQVAFTLTKRGFDLSVLLCQNDSEIY